MAKARQPDNFAVHLLLVIVCAVICVAMVWMYFDYRERTSSYAAYANFGPIVVRGPDFSIRATVAVQTRNDEASVVENNQKAVNFALQSALSEADPTRVRSPEGVAYVQDLMRDAVNHSLRTQAVQNILVTDFVVQSN